MAKGHKDKIAVITGGANGIGAAFAKRLAEDGVHIAVVDLAEGGPTAQVVQGIGRNSIAVQCDVAKPDAVAKMAETVKKELGAPDIVINCAGIFPQRAFLELTYEEWRKVLSTNLDGTFLVTSAFAPGMVQKKWGRVVNMSSSTLGSVTSGFAHYMSSKAGIVGFTRAIFDRSRALRHHGERDLADPDAFAGDAGALAARAVQDHGRGIRGGGANSSDQARRGAGRYRRHGVVSHQR